jgi:hypothetical protein
MHDYFRLWLQGMQALAEKRNKVEAEREGEDLEREHKKAGGMVAR